MSEHKRHALVVEGGGMRGAFTCGVLDAFLKQAFNPFGLFVGVSSGSTSVANYLSGQIGRNIELYLDHSLRREFIHYGRFLKGGDLLDMQWMWQVVEQESPLDQNTLFQQNPDFYMVLTHAIYGHAEYVRASRNNLLDGLRASSSIPVLTRQPVIVDAEPYFDGGVADALPVQWAARQANIDHIMVIRTRPQSYFKASSKGDQFLAKYVLKQYPGFAASLSERCERYNQSVAFIRQPASTAPYILEICPPADHKLANRLCKDRQKLRYSYDVGLDTGAGAIEAWQQLTSS